MSADDLHVYPMNDVHAHILKGADCPCSPITRLNGASLLVVHNSFDFREINEWMEAKRLMVKTFSQNNHYDPGTWKGLQRPVGRSASFTCPVCGQTGALTDHEIAEDGTVSPSVVCPRDGCTFHEYIKLEGWQDG